ncbi:hypothetical protein C6A85_17690, partial [Mycobacterium sp. ITM-2017-0098]
SSQSPCSRPTTPRTIPAGKSCSVSSGTTDFTISDTRTLRDNVTGNTRTICHTVRYVPTPKVMCGAWRLADCTSLVRGG